MRKILNQFAQSTPGLGDFATNFTDKMKRGKIITTHKMNQIITELSSKHDMDNFASRINEFAADKNNQNQNWQDIISKMMDDSDITEALIDNLGSLNKKIKPIVSKQLTSNFDKIRLSNYIFYFFILMNCYFF